MERPIGKRGFTLLELLVVVIIVGILASVALPQFQKMLLKSRTAEGMTTLGSILTAEFLYYQEKGTFTTATGDLTVGVPADNTTLFNYAVPAATASSARVTATGSNTTFNGGKVPATVIITGTINDTGTRTTNVAGA